MEYKDAFEVPTGFVDVPLHLLVKADWNYKKDDAEKARKLTASIKRNGFVQNIIIRPLPTGFLEVVNGNHRIDTLEELGFEKVHAYNCGDISLAAAQRLAVETNEHSFDSDMLKLAQLIEEIKTEYPLDDLVDTMPYHLQELEDFAQLANFDFSQFDAAASTPTDGEGQETESKALHQIMLHFTKEASEDEKAAFGEALESFLEDYPFVLWQNKEKFDSSVKSA